MLSRAEHTKRALEVVFEGDHERLAEFYDPRFRDHVNTMEFAGFEGIGRSNALYRRLFPDLRLEIERQVSDGDLVTSQWVLHGINRGRSVRLSGIAIDRFEDGKIVEAWGATDSIELVRQLGVWRTALMLATEWRTLLELARA